MDSNLDPFSNSRASSYAIESDSEDEEWEDPSSSAPICAVKSARSASKRKEPVVTVGDGQLSWEKETGNVLVGIGEAGMVWTWGMHCEVIEQIGQIKVDEVVVGTILCIKETPLVLISSNLVLDVLHPIAKTVLDFLEPKTITIISTYARQSYLTSAPTDLRTSPIRYLSNGITPLLPSLTPHLSKFAVPNLVEGITSSFALYATSLSVPALILLLPSTTSAGPINTSKVNGVSGKGESGIYDYGTSVPSFKDSPVSAVETLLVLGEIGKELGWGEKVGWDVKTMIEAREPLQGFNWEKKQRNSRAEDSGVSMYL